MAYSKPHSPHVFHILLALAGDPKHGYAIMQEVEQATDGRLRLSTGMLYQALRRLLEEGLIRETGTRDASDSRRRYYVLTPAGRRTLSAETARLADMLRAAGRKHIEPGPVNQ